MEFFKKRSDVFFRGVGAEFVFKTSDGISLVSGGRILKVRVEGPLPGATASRVVLDQCNGNQHVLFEGDAVSASAKFVEIANDATSKRTSVSVSRKGPYAVLAALTAVYLIFCHPVSRAPSQLAAAQTSASDLDALLKAIPSMAGGAGTLNGLNIPSAALNPSLPIQADPSANSVSPVLDRPSFLSLPEDEVSEAKPDKQDPKDSKEASVAAIPAYSADLYSKQASKADPSADKAEAAATKPADDIARSNSADEIAAVKVEEKPAAAPVEIAAAPEVPPVADAAESKDSAARVPLADMSEEKPADDKPDAGDAAKAAKDATKNMSAAETAELLKQIEQMMQMDPTAITPDMLAKLPHEIAQTLRDTGVIGNPEAMPEKGNAPYAAIRLPPGAIDKFRGKDGIASIPENDTFAALGNKILLQLPGGGDIRKPEDLRLFGFEP